MVSFRTAVFNQRYGAVGINIVSLSARISVQQRSYAVNQDNIVPAPPEALFYRRRFAAESIMRIPVVVEVKIENIPYFRCVPCIGYPCEDTVEPCNKLCEKRNPLVHRTKARRA